MKSSWVLNASPLIALGKAKLLKTVSPPAKTWIIPKGVIRELAIKGPTQSILSQLATGADVITGVVIY